MEPKSLGELLGVPDPRPETERPVSDFDQLAGITDAQEFCQRILQTREWRQYVMNGIVLGDLPSAVMCRIIDHAWGRVTERLEVSELSTLDGMTVEQLEARALFLAGTARRMRSDAQLGAEQQGSVH